MPPSISVKLSTELTPAAFDWMMNVNLRHAVFAAQAVVPHMRELGAGSIVNTSSVAWMRGIVDLELYSATKAALIGFTNSLAREVGPFRVRVNAIAPGHVPTPRQRALWHDDAVKRPDARLAMPSRSHRAARHRQFGGVSLLRRRAHDHETMFDDQRRFAVKLRNFTIVEERVAPSGDRRPWQAADAARRYRPEPSCRALPSRSIIR